VSVVIPAHDAEATLGDQLAALARQSAPVAYEVLVCDNGSRDGTAAVARSWATRAPVRVVDAAARRGPGAARNIGAAAADAPLLAFCDADDVVDDDWLAEIVAGLGEFDLVAGGSGFALLNGHSLGRPDWQDPLFRTPQAPALVGASSSNLGIRAAMLERVGGFDELLHAAEDVDLCWRVQFAGGRVGARSTARVQLRRRATLRGAFRQAYGYGVGDRALARKYGDLGAYRPPVAASTAVGDWPPPDGPRERRALRRADLAFAAERLGRSLGRRFGRVDPRIERRRPDA
jgi:glycosyltransferase involved in cell wall biosynthesis